MATPLLKHTVCTNVKMLPFFCFPLRYSLFCCRSESPSQVFMIVINMLYAEMKDLPKEQIENMMSNYVLSYDNMCHLDNLRVAKEVLPLPAPFDTVWQRINKVIDRLHLGNHKDRRCHQKYNPDDVLPEGSNTMASEQLFSWLSRFKKIVNSMTQTHHLFFLHRMCKRRNAYTAACRKKGQEPLLPGINQVLAQKYQ